MSATRARTPAEMSFRMPAEWEPHQATWFSWPHNVETWPEDLLASRALSRYRRRASITTFAEVLAVVLQLYERFRRLDREAQQASARMDELRRAKGAL